MSPEVLLEAVKEMVYGGVNFINHIVPYDIIDKHGMIQRIDAATGRHNFDFDLPILQDTSVYATWDYLNPAIALAQLTQSIVGDRFESTTMTLTLPLYEPLKEDVRFQWQAAPQNSSDFSCPDTVL